MIGKRITNFKNYILDMSKYYIQKKQEQFYLAKQAKAYVLMFHYVGNYEDIWADAEYSISATSLKEMVTLLQKEGFEFCTLDDILKKKTEKRVAITFDDAYEGVYTEMFAFFKEKNIPFTAFQTVSFLGQPGYLTEDMIKAMLEYKGFTLGAHTITHCDLHQTINWKGEIENPIYIYRERFGIKPAYFAYPYGAYITINWKNIKYVSKKYEAAFSTCNTGIFHKKFISKYMLPRMNINENNYKNVMGRLTCKKMKA